MTEAPPPRELALRPFHIQASIVLTFETEEEADEARRGRVEREQRRKRDRETFFRMVDALGGGK